eukprot:gene9986-11044_t
MAANRSRKKASGKSRNNSSSTVLHKVLSKVLPAAVFASQGMSRKSSKGRSASGYGGGGASDSVKSFGSVGSKSVIGGNNKVTPMKDGGASVGGGGGLVVIRAAERIDHP